MDNKINISVIIPVYNVEKYLSKCLDSIINQTYSNFEVILIDDGSTDNSSNICDKYSKKDKRIKAIHNKNKGVSFSRNCGLDIASGKYILFIDSDDTIDEDYLEKLINNSKKEELICSNCIVETLVNNKKIDNSGRTYSVSEYIDLIINSKLMGTCWGKLFKKSELKNLKFDNNTYYMEDTLFLLQYLMNSSIKNVRFCDTNYHYNCLNDSSLTKNKKIDVLNRLKNIFYSYDKLDELTDKYYTNIINRKKIKVVKKNMENIECIEDLKKIVCNTKLKKDFENKYSLFYYLYENKKIKTLFIISKTRQKAKKISKIIIKKIKK